MRIVLDTNVFVSSFFGGKPKEIIRLWTRSEVILCISPAIMEEYIVVVRRLGLDKRPELDELLALFKRSHSTCFSAAVPELHVVTADPEDDKFIACAVELKAKAIVSGDHHLLELGTYIDIPILSPSEFLHKHCAR